MLNSKIKIPKSQKHDKRDKRDKNAIEFNSSDFDENYSRD